MNNNQQIRKQLRKVPPPAKGWEARLIRAIVKYPQHKQPLGPLAALVTWLARRAIWAPALATLCLLIVGLWQPLGPNGTDAQYRAAISYTEEISGLAEDEEDPSTIIETLNSWIPGN